MDGGSIPPISTIPPPRFFVDRCEPLNPGDRDRAVFDERRDCAVNVGAVALEHHTQVFSFLERVALLELYDCVLNKRCHRVIVHALTLAGVLLCRLVAYAHHARGRLILSWMERGFPLG